MGHSKTPGPVGQDVFEAICSADSPGVLGFNDRADPGMCTVAGDTPGTVGLNDLAELQCREEDVFLGFPDEPKLEAKAGPADSEVYVVDEDTLLDYAKTTLGFAGSVLDSTTMIRALQDFGFTLKGDDFYLKTYKGKKYIIFKGYPGLRKTLKAPRYFADNIKVVNMMIGRKALMKSAVKSGMLSFVLVGAVSVVEYVMDDKALLTDLGVTLFSDLSKAAISSAAGFAAGAAVATVVTGVVVAPIAAGIVIGVLVSVVLEIVDEKYQLTARLTAWVNEAVEPLRVDYRRAERMWEFLNRSDGEGVRWLQRMLTQ